MGRGTMGGMGAQRGPGGLRSGLARWRAAPSRRPQGRSEWVRAGAWAFVGFGLLAPFIRQAVGYDSVAFLFTLVPALLVFLWVAPRRGHLHTWLVYAVAIYFFTQLRDAADETFIQASAGYVLDWELWMFDGVIPSAWLQQHLGGSDGNPGVLAYLASAVHWSWFVFPHAVVVGTYFLAPRMFFRVAAIIAGTFYFAVVLYYLIPTVPPWLAVEQGATTDIRRIIADVGVQIFGEPTKDRLFALLAEPNSRAAMPSLHFAASFVVVITGIIVRSRRLIALAMGYSLMLAFSLVYLGEHYIADIIAGGASALVAIFLVETALGNGPGNRLLHWARTTRRRLPLTLLAPPAPRTFPPAPDPRRPD